MSDVQKGNGNGNGNGKKDDDNGNDFVTHSECASVMRPALEKIDLLYESNVKRDITLFGTDGRGGIVKDINQILTIISQMERSNTSDRNERTTEKANAKKNESAIKVAGLELSGKRFIALISLAGIIVVAVLQLMGEIFEHVIFH